MLDATIPIGQLQQVNLNLQDFDIFLDFDLSHHIRGWRRTTWTGHLHIH